MHALTPALPTAIPSCFCTTMWMLGPIAFWPPLRRRLLWTTGSPKRMPLGDSALVELGESQRAREWLSRALAIDPDDPMTQYNVACGYSTLGDIDAAFDLLERWLPFVSH